MNIYTLYIHDDRYSVPSLYMVTLPDDARAREAGAARLSYSGHYQKIEVFEGDRLVCTVEPGAANE